MSPKHAPFSSVRIQVISDVHAEFGPHAVPRQEDVATDADILLVAGDLAAAPNAVHLAADLFPTVPVLILVGGNHEHYRTGVTIDEGLEDMRLAAAEISAAESRSVAVLENDAMVVSVGGIAVRVLGATLWTDYALL